MDEGSGDGTDLEELPRKWEEQLVKFGVISQRLILVVMQDLF